MLSVKDALTIFDKIPIWKILKGLPDRVSSLEKKVEALEQRPDLETPPTCPYCFKGEQFIKERTTFPMAEKPHEEQLWICQNPDCGKEDRKTIFVK